MGIEFTPTFEGYGSGGIIARGMPTGNGWPQAKLTYDTVCAACGGRFKKGDRVTAQLAIPPAEGTWRHALCAPPPLDREDTFTAQRALDELNRKRSHG